MRIFAPFATILLAVLAAGTTVGLGAQAPAGPVHVSGPAQAAPTQTQANPPHMQFRVSLVQLPVTVRDRHGELAIDLGPEDFKVYDNGVVQQIEHFDLGGDPLAVVLVVENSSRVASLLPAIRNAGIVFTEVVMGSNSEGAVITFDDTSQVLVPLTADHDRIQKAISGLKSGDDGARLYDALAHAIKLLQNEPLSRRRVIVAVSESVDTGSEDKLGSLLREAQLANVAIDAIGLSTTNAKLHAEPNQYSPSQIGPPGTFPTAGMPGVPQTPGEQAITNGDANLLAMVEELVKHGLNLVTQQALAAASAATGGDNISTFRDRAIEPAMDRIGGDLHAQYTLAYAAPLHGPFGYHDITVTISRPGYNIRTRPGYFLEPPNGSTGDNQ